MFSDGKMRAERCGELKLKTDFLATFGQPSCAATQSIKRGGERSVQSKTDVTRRSAGLNFLGKFAAISVSRTLSQNFADGMKAQPRNSAGKMRALPAKLLGTAPLPSVAMLQATK
jgi:hypothetical protein